MPSHKVIFMPEALADIEGIRDYIALDNPDAADRIVNELTHAADGLADLPERFVVIRSRRKLAFALRALIVRSYRVLYSIEGDTVSIRTIRHGRRRPWP
jgi:addiction module RelE/StbE family toxin